jgi:hypothetical protein
LKQVRSKGAYHLALLLAVDQVVVVLHRDKLVPSILLRNVLQRLELPCRHRTCANVSHPALLNDIVERLHDFFAWCVAVQTVDLQDVDVCAQSLDTLLHSIEDVLAAQADFVHGLAVVG